MNHPASTPKTASVAVLQPQAAIELGASAMNHELNAAAAKARELRVLLAVIAALTAPTANTELADLVSLARQVGAELANDVGVLAELATA